MISRLSCSLAEFLPGSASLRMLCTALAVAWGGSAVHARDMSRAAAERDTSAALEGLRGNGAALRSFLLEMPKGADLHNHLAGAVYAESALAWARAEGWCFDVKSKAALPPPCDAASKPPLAEALRSTQAYRDAVNAWSMRDVITARVSGHDQFFNSFFRFSDVTGNNIGAALAEVVERAASQNVLYLELMISPLMGEARDLGAGIGWKDDPDAMLAALDGKGLQDLVKRATESVVAVAADKDRRLACSDAVHRRPGCDVAVRFLAQVYRNVDRANLFAQTALAARLASLDGPVVGLNLVAAEDDEITLGNYSDQMRIVGDIGRRHPKSRISLHAGELTMGLVPPKDLTFHIREAVEVAGAGRIGHGVDIGFERNAKELMARMAREGIMVEINLTSNAQILGVEGDDHPFPLYRKAGVPTALSTDDEGVSRIDLTHEYQRAARVYQLSYRDLKQLSRNSLTYAFLPGESLWRDPAAARPVSACLNAQFGGTAPSAECRRFLAGSEKARLQWELETRFARFESTWRGGGGKPANSVALASPPWSSAKRERSSRSVR
ncbi:adenosine deaminase family protein [Methylocystis sp. H62]|uniref:adenosine deaminase family protein n=1 Tax=Methylocystis sp. H62 TaxID=2785789 RepID=UPI001FEFFB8F|nr:adenosine deaminase [Methylocystis sp. H62]